MKSLFPNYWHVLNKVLSFLTQTISWMIDAMSEKPTQKVSTADQGEQGRTKTRQELIDEFILLEAVTPDKALPQEKFGFNWQENSHHLNALEKKGVIKSVIPEEEQLGVSLYYYDLSVEKSKKDFFIKLTAIIIPGIIFILLGIVWLLSTR
jgi:DNA-binding transcriptional ArsR family regulator